MATISTGIQLYDKVSAPINNMLGALNNMIHAFESVDNSMNGAFDSSEVDDARNHIQQATAQVIALGQEIEDNERKQDDFNDEVEKSVGLGETLKAALGGVGLYFGLSEIKNQVTQAIDFASDLQEVQNVVDVAFGGSAKTIDEWATTTLNAYGLNELSAKRFAGTMGAMLKSSGMSGEAVSEMSMKITELAGDMASFYNLEGEEAFNKLRSGISGETEPLKQLGINMSVANLEAFALSQGITKSFNAMSQAEQVMLRYNYMMQATGDAQGDFARTQDSFANQTKLLAENWKAFTGELAGNLLPILAGGIRALNSIIGFVADNWSIISPILLGVAAALGVYFIAVKGATIATKAAELATKAWTAVQAFFNGVMALNPIFLIIMGIILLISLIYAVVAAINKVTGKSINATGMIVGALMAAVAFIWNLFLGLLDIVLAVVNWMWNRWAMFANFFANLFNDPIGSIIHLFGDMADNVLGILENIAKAMDKLFGSNMAGTIQGWRSSLDSLVEGAANKYGNGSYEKVVEELNLSSESLGLKRWAYTDAYNTGYGWGEKAGDAISDALDTSSLAEDMAETAENTGKSAKSLEVTSEDLKYLRDIAERETINRFTTAEIKVDMKNTNTINSNMDLDGIVDYLANGVNEAMEKAAEGVYA